jgi:hypothetical protein
MIFALAISFKAYCFLVFFIWTFQTFPKPPFPTTYRNSKWFLLTKLHKMVI